MKQKVPLKTILLLIPFLFIFLENGYTQEIPKLENPINEQYIKRNLRKSQPRLVLNTSLERDLKRNIKSDPVVKNMYKAVKQNATEIHNQPLLERRQIGRRLLSVSREMLYRANMLGMVYRIEKDPATLKRLNDEVVAVCNFSDWNPSRYLDVAEMSMTKRDDGR